MRAAASLLALLALLGCNRYTQVQMARGTDYEVQPAFAKVNEGQVAVRRRVDGAAEPPRPIALQISEVEDVRHPGLGRIIVGGVLTGTALGSAAAAARVARTCDSAGCARAPLRASRSAWVATSFTSALLIHGLHLSLRSRGAFAGEASLDETRSRYIRAGAGLLAGGSALLVTDALIGALRGPDSGAFDPDDQNDDSVGRLGYVLAPTAATWMIAGAIFLARGVRLDPDDVPDLSVGVSAHRRGAEASLRTSF